jgi:hypothetical protein
MMIYSDAERHGMRRVAKIGIGIFIVANLLMLVGHLTS